MELIFRVFIGVVAVLCMGVLCSLLYYLNSVKEEFWEEIYKRMGN